MTNEYVIKDYELVGSVSALQELRKKIHHLAEKRDTTILITGETGTGKECVARNIHYYSKQADTLSGDFVVFDCVAYTADLMHSNLFGHRRGSFTGAIDDYEGLAVKANKGTLLLDEISSMPFELQAKLLRFLQEKIVHPLGGKETTKVDLRIIAATNQDLNTMVNDRYFRNDLYFRLNVVNLYIPPLRERKEDIPELVDFFLKRYHERLEENVKLRNFHDEALAMLSEYNWPGNIRELENLINACIASTDDNPITPNTLNGVWAKATETDIAGDGLLDLVDSLREDDKGLLETAERELIQKVLDSNDWNKRKSAQQLGIKHPKTLLDKIKKYGLQDPRGNSAVKVI